MKPLVSVCIQTYQHSPFISECLDSILCQKTDFPFEVLLGEDCSTDGTREICIEYAEKHPDKIRLFLHTRDTVIYINGNATGRYNFTNNLTHAKGKYIALCDGDDYWTDTNKLQRQVDFLEANDDYAVCFHNAKILKDGTLVDNYLKNRVAETTTILDLAQNNYIYTASCLVRNCFSGCLPDFFYTSPVADYPFLMIAALNGKIRYIDNVMSVYRIHDGGIWSVKTKLERLEASALVQKTLMENFTGEVKGILTDNYITLLKEIIRKYKQIDNKSKTIDNGINNPYYIQENTSFTVILKALIAKIQLDIFRLN